MQAVFSIFLENYDQIFIIQDESIQMSTLTYEHWGTIGWSFRFSCHHNDIQVDLPTLAVELLNSYPAPFFLFSCFYVSALYVG